MSDSSLPQLFLDRLKVILPQAYLEGVLESFNLPEPLAVRVNTLKVTDEEMRRLLEAKGIHCEAVGWCPGILIVMGVPKSELSSCPEVSEGLLYFQNPSSLLPAMILAPKPGEKVLDLCAAPGSKTTQMAAMMENQGQITAVEVVKARFYRLKAVCALLGATNISFKISDGRYLRASENELFDKVLVDVPCSSEGRFKAFDPKTYAYWSPRKIKEMAHKQKGLLLNASRLVKPGGDLVYSTCTFSPEENESVVDWFLRKSKDFEICPINISGVQSYPALMEWQERAFSSEVSKSVRVMPQGIMSGFFIAHFKRMI